MPKTGILAGSASDGPDGAVRDGVRQSLPAGGLIETFSERIAARHGAALTGARRLIEAGLMVSLSWTAGRAVWLVADPAGSVAARLPAPLVAEAGPAGQLRLTDLGILERMSLFGEPDGASSLDYLPETQLNLRLAGLRSAEGGQGMAIISVSGAPAKMFHPGDTLVEGVVIESIHASHVVLRKRDGIETLSLRGDRNHENSQASGSVDRPVRTVTAADFAALVLDPATQGGAQIGYQVAAGNDDALLERFGLASGDVLLSVDGQSLAHLSPVELVDRMTGGAPLRVAARRGGHLFEQVFQLQDTPTR